MKKVFIDTNIFLEYLEQRREYIAVSKILSAVENREIEAVISVGSAYTLAYLVRMELKKRGIHRPEQTVQLRDVLKTILSLVKVVGTGHKNMLAALDDSAFDDMEDSFQYRCALQNKCDALVTINLRDFHGAEASKIEVLSPTEFANKYI